MSDSSLDRRAREASRAARSAVAPVLAVPSAFNRRHRTPTVRIASVAVAVSLLGGLIALAALRPAGTTVSTGPASDLPETRIEPPLPTDSPPLDSPIEPPIASGGTSDGKTWQLFIGGPSHELCLGVVVGKIRTDACAGGPAGAPAPDPYRPHLHEDSRIVPTVFGRVTPDIVSVEVVQVNRPSLGRVPVIQAGGGPFYRVEVPDASRPIVVIGYRAAGTSVRYNLPG